MRPVTQGSRAGGSSCENPRGISHPDCDSDVSLAVASALSTCVRLRVKQGSRDRGSVFMALVFRTYIAR